MNPCRPTVQLASFTHRNVSTLNQCFDGFLLPGSKFVFFILFYFIDQIDFFLDPEKDPEKEICLKKRGN